MMQWNVGARTIALAVVVSLAFPSIHAADTVDPATLSGVIRASDQAPLSEVRLLAVSPTTGEVISSEPTSADGNFTLSDLPPGTYELAVASGETLYLVEQSVYLVPGVTRQVQIAVASLDETSRTLRREDLPLSWKNNPLVAAFIVFTAAVVVGVLVENATEDEVDTTLTNP